MFGGDSARVRISVGSTSRQISRGICSGSCLLGFVLSSGFCSSIVPVCLFSPLGVHISTVSEVEHGPRGRVGVDGEAHGGERRQRPLLFLVSGEKMKPEMKTPGEISSTATSHESWRDALLKESNNPGRQVLFARVDGKMASFTLTSFRRC